MTTVDTFGAYVSARLEEWGREFALHRDCEYLGHQSVNMLQVLIDHKGEMPARPTGFKPLEVNQAAHQIELIVTDIARDQLDLACVLRAYYCGSGRKKVERYETALLLIAHAHRDEPGWHKLPNVQRFFAMHDIGFAQVRGVLQGIALAA